MLVNQFLENSARRSPDKVALICGGRRLTYREIEERSNRMARGLTARGVERGDRVAVYLDNSVESVVAIFGALKAGAVFVVVNPSVKPGKLAYILKDCAARALLTDAVRARAVREACSDTPSLRALLDGGAETGECDSTLPATAGRCIDIDLAALIYTSGSTGKPKGVMLTHLNMVSAATSITTYLENAPDDIVIDLLPLSFDYGLYQVLMAFQAGATLVLEKSFAYPHDVMKRVVRERVTGLPLVPTMSAILLQLDLSRYDLSRLRYITNTAAALPTEHIVKLRRLLPHVRIYSMYGLTECKRVSYLPPEQIDIRPASVGRGMPNEEVYIVDPEGRRVPPGVPGELVVRGSNVMKGYWGLPAETERVLRPGPLPYERVLHTGDIFRADSEGYLYFLGRRDDIIKTRGERVSPKEIEDVLYGLEGIAEAAVMGVPDEILGQAIKAVVAPATGVRVTVQDVLAHCRAHLEDYMVPKYVEVRDALPKTTSGKISKLALKETAEVQE